MSALSKALSQLKTGGMIILVDDEVRENEGDLVIAGEFATPEAVNFMAMHGRGLICLALDSAQFAGEVGCAAQAIVVRVRARPMQVPQFGIDASCDEFGFEAFGEA